jgi:AcrR family transcriptional regulator
MGRPREHDEETRHALLDAAEAIVEAQGPDALSVRAAADAVGVSTRAVYSSFGSKAGLLDALSQRAYELLGTAIRALPVTDDPAGDVVEAGLRVFRPMATGHPSLFRLAFQRIVPEVKVGEGTRAAAADAFALLCGRFERLEAQGRLGGRDARTAAAAFNALCEGLATTELRVPGLLGPDPEAAWRDAFAALVSGFDAAPAPRVVKRGRSTGGTPSRRGRARG